MDLHPPPPPRRQVTSGVVVLVVLLWVFVGWPVSWILLLFGSPPLGLLFGVGITAGLIAFLATVGRGPAPRPVRPVPVPAHIARYQAMRREVESFAFVDAAGGCGWCGSSSAHVDDVGRQVHPRGWHHAEIEERIRTKTG